AAATPTTATTRTRPCPGADPGTGRTAVLSRIAESLFWIGRFVERAEENARRARETVSTELWEAINTAWNRWGGFEPDQVTARQLAWVRERAALVSGVAD